MIACSHISPEHGSFALTLNVISPPACGYLAARQPLRYSLNSSVSGCVPLVSNVISFSACITGWSSSAGYARCQPSKGSPPVIIRCSSFHSLLGSNIQIFSASSVVPIIGLNSLNFGCQDAYESQPVVTRGSSSYARYCFGSINSTSLDRHPRSIPNPAHVKLHPNVRRNTLGTPTYLPSP